MKLKKYNSDLDAFDDLKYGDLVATIHVLKFPNEQEIIESVEIFLFAEWIQSVLIFNYFTIKHIHKEFVNTHWSDHWSMFYRKLEP